jgi:hypothetical protein
VQQQDLPLLLSQPLLPAQLQQQHRQLVMAEDSPNSNLSSSAGAAIASKPAATAVDDVDSSRPGTSGTSYSALSIYTDQQLTARSNAHDAEAAALLRWQQQKQGIHVEAAVTAETPQSSTACSEPAIASAASAVQSSTTSAVSSSDDSNAGSRSTTAASSSSETSATTSTTGSCSTSAAPGHGSGAAAAAAAAAVCGADVLTLQQFQAVLVLLSRKCFPRIANAARAWKLLIERHIQPLADRKRSR